MNGRRATGLVSVALCFVFALSVACSHGSAKPTSTPGPETPSATASPTASPTATASATGADPPDRNLLDLARRFDGYDGPSVARTEPLDYHVGDQATFSSLDLDAVKEYDITATVRAVTDHAYFFVEDSAPYTQAAVDASAADFESVVWPTITGSFGFPATPGVDGDPRITILNANLSGAGGFVVGADAYPAVAVPRSNEREMVYVEANALGSAADYNPLVAHELQHLIHEENDVNEESWVNEGLSQVAWEMAGGSTDGVWEFLGKPDTQLNYWPVDGVSIHYAESELFFDYVLDHYGGRDHAKPLTSEKANGIPGVAAYLAGFGKTFDEVFADFVAANLIDAPSGPYSHDNFDGTVSGTGDQQPGDQGNGEVSQFGTDYMHLGGGTFTFDGADDVTIGIEPVDGPFFWSGRNDGVDSRLTREADLSGVTAATLDFDAWWDVEDGWDYGYVAVSDDGGKSWAALPATDTSGDNPVSAAYGPGYTGKSGGWKHQQVDLGAYAGKKILVRFEYITDDATNLTGFAVDNITIGAIGLHDDASSLDGWQDEGFQQIDGPMHQEFIVQVVSDAGEVTHVALDAGNAATITLDGPATIAISGATNHTTEPATYEWAVQ